MAFVRSTRATHAFGSAPHVVTHDRRGDGGVERFGMAEAGNRDAPGYARGHRGREAVAFVADYDHGITEGSDRMNIVTREIAAEDRDLRRREGAIEIHRERWHAGK